jgi:hypothetical protein
MGGDMTKEEMSELDRWLGENVMRWKLGMEYKSSGEGWSMIPVVHKAYFDPNGKLLFYQHVWHPTRKVAQAIECAEECAEKIDKPYSLSRIVRNYYVAEVGIEFAYEETLALALSLACKKAWENK